jgi:hypothetical protein
MAEAIFKGKSGQLHRFSVLSPDFDFAAAPAVYAFARPAGRGWTPVFLSRTANLAQRMAWHERWEEARKLGATHVLVHQRAKRDAREAVEADLLAVLRPVMNGAFDAAKAMHAPADKAKVVAFPSFGLGQARAARA